MTERLVKTKYNDDSAITLLNPLSNEHENKLIVIFEDAYGSIEMNLMTDKAIIMNYDITKEELVKFRNNEIS